MAKQNYENWTRDALRKEALRLGVQDHKKLTKALLIAGIEAALAARAGKRKPKAKAPAAPPPPPAPPPAERPVSHLAFILDESGSMDYICEPAREAMNAAVRSAKSEAYKRGMGDTSTVTFVTFSDGVRFPLGVRQPLDKLQTLGVGDYRPDGMTALFDAVGLTAEEMLAKPDADKDNVSFMFVVVTDGGENRSRKYNGASIGELLKRLQRTDRWTFAFLVPSESHKNQLVRGYGIPDGNVAVWTATEAGVKAAGVAIACGTQSFYAARSAGQKSVRNYFYTDMSNVTQADLDKLVDLSPQVREARVDHDIDVETFCKARFGGYVLGGLYYELTKLVEIQPYKKILITETNGSRIFGGAQARKLLKLPDHTLKVKPGDHAGYKIFVQSTSVNRKLLAGTMVLYAPNL